MLLVFASLSLPPCTESLRQQREHHNYDPIDLRTDVLDLTSVFSDSGEGPRYVTLKDEKKYMCCCFAEKGVDEISCKLRSVDMQKSQWWKSGCGGYIGLHWHSWHNVVSNNPHAALLPGAGSCMVPEDQLPNVLTSTSTSTFTTTVTTTKKPGPTIVNFDGSQYKKIDGQWTKCCCRSDVLSKPKESSKVVCELMSVKHGQTLSNTLGYHELPPDFEPADHEWVGCKQLKGAGYHSWNNMGAKYKELDYFNECAIPAS